jgi:Flp pilus assembly protein TadB
LTLVVLIILAVLWAVVLLPPMLRSRAERANDSIGDFNYRLDVLGRTNGALRAAGARPRVSPGQRAAKRRRDVLRALLGVVGGFGLLAMATNALVFWVLFIAGAIAFAAFCALWAWARSLQMERAMKVRSMDRRLSPDWAALRRAASS